MPRRAAARLAGAFAAALALSASLPAFGADPAPKTLAVLDIEVEGDMSDAARLPEWEARADLLRRTLKAELDAAGLYRVLDDAPAADLLADLRTRRGVHACEACILEVAQRLDSDRVLSARVFRMSNLVLTLHIDVRDGDTGAVVVRKILDFRGDNDHAWLKAGAYFVRWLGEEQGRR
ncbi:DUF2380 domain-containing protein [Azospirillum halopraeferens]|uniref:DUF2380 domain-containing protein n=1 Tax=Azospirillum halopraeferens TaxID=34010 RepID=UPI0003FDD9DC|nr:DUF2380 domain-containing protein [Azospirillum halopraeferens]